MEKIIDGKYILLGRYFQDGEKKEPIRWKIIKNEEGVLTLISDLVMFNREYDEKYCNYKNSSLRKYINEVFVKDAFNSEELNLILDTALEEVIDKVYVPSLEELDKFDLIRYATPYAIENGISVGDNNAAYYWTRSQYKPSYREAHPREVCYVDCDGNPDFGMVWSDDVGVVLMMRIKI